MPAGDYGSLPTGLVQPLLMPHRSSAKVRSQHRNFLLMPFDRLWYDTLDNAIGYAMHCSRSHDALIRVYDDADNLIKTYEHRGDFKEW
jgi:hypothetical protein